MKNRVASLCFAGVLVSGGTEAGTAQDVAAGQNLFVHACTTCHDNTPYMVKADGPALFGVVGRRVGSVDGFYYSPALQMANRRHDKWSESALDQFLINPGRMYPGTTMPWSFATHDDRKMMIAYLKSLKPEK